MMDKNGISFFDADVQAAWRQSWPKLSVDVDSFILIAFRVLVFHLNQQEFFLQPPAGIVDVKGRAEPPPELMMLLRTSDASSIPIFANLVDTRLDSAHVTEAGMLAFSIDAHLGHKLCNILRQGNRKGLQKLARAVNTANRILLGQLAGARPLILVRSPTRYWSKRKLVVPEFPLPPQSVPSNFKHLLPLSSSLKRVHYSAIGSGLQEQKLNVTLWPVQAPSIRSRAIRKTRAKHGRIRFHFKRWNNLPKTHQQQQRAFAKLIEDYILREASDDRGTLHVIAAPELTLAPESIDSIIRAVETRRNAAWIVFPGSYHIELPGGFINCAQIFLGGVLHPNDLCGDPQYADKAAVKCVPVVFPGRRKLEEDIDRRESFTHVLDTSVGRIAVMICRDFLEDYLRNEIVLMCVDHIFVLSMSPDSGIKFKTAMESASHSRTGCFFVNAFSDVKRRAAHRKPLKGGRVNWMRQGTIDTHYRVILKPE